jgi:glycosyltransferase involved in cell wall biosynthesis
MPTPENPRNDTDPAGDGLVCQVCYIIPTFNRVDALMICLEHLERQTCSDFEVIVVNDGSTDSTARQMDSYAARTSLRLRYRSQPNSGPARARNLAISMTKAPLCLMIGDDIFVCPEFTEAHLDFHREHPALNVAALGLTRWSESHQLVTPFMRWMDECGGQFAYGDLMRGTKPGWRHFYTSNLSVKTQLLRENPFNEAFTQRRWMMEDMELGYRLERTRSLEIVFLPRALADHLHPTDFRKACDRADKAGASLRLFDELWPDRPVPAHGPVHRALREILFWNSWVLAPLTALTDFLTRFWCPNPLMRPVLAYHAALSRRREG